MKKLFLQKLNKGFALCLCTALLFCAAAYGSTAAGSTFSIVTVCENGMPGETVFVDVQIKNASVGSLTVNVNYDATRLEFVSAQVGEAGSLFPITSANRVGTSAQIRFSALTSDSTNLTLNGSLMKVYFRVLASSGTAGVSLSGVAYSATAEKLIPAYENGTVFVNSAQSVCVPVGVSASRADALMAQYKNSSNTVVIQAANGTEITGNTPVGTGAIILINDTVRIPVVVIADLSGDGLITSADYAQLKRASVGTVQLSGSAEAAADLNGDGVVDAFDTACLDLVLAS